MSQFNKYKILKNMKATLILLLCTFILIPTTFIYAMPPTEETIVFTARSKPEKPKYSGHFETIETQYSWNTKETAVVIVDMWDKHWCSGPTIRVAELAPAIDEFIAKARSRGILIIHAPSDTMDFYKEFPERQTAITTPPAPYIPEGLKHWCNYINFRERIAKQPIDVADGGCETGETYQGPVWTRQISLINIMPEDIISASGVEIWNVLKARAIKNVLMVGVHTNMCVVARPFGLRNLSRYGINTILIRDLTDAAYNPASSPYVNHFAGTRLYIDYIEKFISPTTTSTFLTGKPEFKFKEDPDKLKS